MVAITQLYRSIPDKAFKTGTTDRDKEFACWKTVKEELNLPLYFADPNSSWQRKLQRSTTRVLSQENESCFG